MSTEPAHQGSVSIDEAIEELAAFASSGVDEAAVRGRQFDLGLAWPEFPVGFGGRGLDGPSAKIAERALATRGLHRSPRGFVGPNLVAPLLVKHGRAAQAELLRPIFTGEHIWCQLFSEPSAGSDLANVSTLAVRDGSCWLLRGQKVWNSFAAEATHGIVLTRSDPEIPKHRGMTLFLLDMRTRGIDVRPLRDMTGHAHFNEVFLDDVVVDDEWRLGPAHDGWGLALEVLRHERMAIGRSGAEARAVRTSPLDHVRRSSSVSPTHRDRVVRAWINEQVLGYTMMRLVADARAGRTALNEIAVRVLATEHNFEVLNLAIDSGGPRGMLHPCGYEDANAAEPIEEADVVRDFLYSRGLMIGGGTLEICRNQIGERILGLPPEPRVDKEGPWRATSGLRRAAGEA